MNLILFFNFRIGFSYQVMLLVHFACSIFGTALHEVPNKVLDWSTRTSIIFAKNHFKGKMPKTNKWKTIYQKIKIKTKWIKSSVADHQFFKINNFQSRNIVYKHSYCVLIWLAFLHFSTSMWICIKNT